nr:integrase, catalytic region, zinc finger, CCHC-type, peptidase aspartic, catalytic [Tanacetum cinerariifolium]
MSTHSSARNLFPPLDNPELTIRKRSRVDPTLLNDFNMATDENGDPPVLDLRTMEELCQPILDGRGGPIAPIAIQAMNGLKNDMIQQVQNSCQFHGLPGDDANKHIDKCLHVTQSIKVNGVTDDALRLYLFPYSLTHHAIAWFDRLPRNSIITFEQMAKIFLGKYFPPSMVTKLRNEITNFRQQEEVTETVFDNRSSDEENGLANDRFKKGEGYQAVPPPLTRNYMPSKSDLSFARLDDSIYKFKISEIVTSLTKDEKDTLETSTAEGNSLVRAVTTASLDAQQDSSNIAKTQSKATLNEPNTQGEGSGSGLGCQETIGGAMAQLRPEGAPIQSIDPPLSTGNTVGSEEDRMEHAIELTDPVPQTPHDLPLSGGHTPGSDEGSMTLKELTDLCTTLSQKVLDLEKVKTAQAKEIASRRNVSKQERKNLKSQQKFQDIDKLVDEGMNFVLDEDAEKTKEFNLDADTKVIVKERGSGEKGGSTAEIVSTARPDISTTRPEVSAAKPKTPPTIITLFNDKDATIADTLVNMKNQKAKEKGVAFKDADDSARPIRSITTLEPLPTINLKDKGRFTHAQLKSRSFEEIQKLYTKEQKWVDAFVPIGSKEDEKRVGSRKKRAAGLMEATDISQLSLESLKLDKQDVLDLHKIIIESEDDEIYKNQQDWKLLSWKLYENYGIHTLMLDDSLVSINMFVEKRLKKSKVFGYIVLVIMKLIMKKLDFHQIGIITSRFRRYLNQKRENRKWLNKAIDEGPYEFRIFTPSKTKAPRMQKEEDLSGDDLEHYKVEIEVMNLILISISNDIYNSVDACTTAKSMWPRVECLMRGTVQNKVDRETRFNNEFDQFVVEPEEAPVLVYNLFVQLMNDLERNGIIFPKVTINTKIQPVNFDSNEGPSYDSAFLSKVQTPFTSYVNPLFAKETQEQKYLKQPKIINNIIRDDQIDINIIFSEPNEDVNSGSVEYDNNVQESYSLEQLATNAYKEAEKQQIIAKKVQQQNTLLIKQLESYKVDKNAKRFEQESQSQFIRDRDPIRDLEQQRDKLDLSVVELKRQIMKLQKNQTILKQRMSENEDKYHDTVIDLKARAKKNEDVMLRMGNSLQEMFMLGLKPMSFYDLKVKHGLGYTNLYTLNKAISQNPKLYDASCLDDSKIQMNVRDSKDILNDAIRNNSMQDEIERIQRDSNEIQEGMQKQLNILENDVQRCLGHNLFSVGQFCDGDLEVAFLSKSCCVRNLKGDDMLTGDRESNLYTIFIFDMVAPSPVCLLSKATLTKSWLWHHKLSYLNFGTINDFTKHELVNGLLKFKYKKDHLCSAFEWGKSKKASHPPKLVLSNHSKLELLHMDLCGPMRVASINEKMYILVIVDDYSQFTWVYLLRT